MKKCYLPLNWAPILCGSLKRNLNIIYCVDSFDMILQENSFHYHFLLFFQQTIFFALPKSKRSNFLTIFQLFKLLWKITIFLKLKLTFKEELCINFLKSWFQSYFSVPYLKSVSVYFYTNDNYNTKLIHTLMPIHKVQ